MSYTPWDWNDPSNWDGQRDPRDSYGQRPGGPDGGAAAQLALVIGQHCVTERLIGQHCVTECLIGQHCVTECLIGHTRGKSS